MAHKILMVEDDFALAMGTEYALTSEGYAVATAGNLAQAREKFDRDRFLSIYQPKWAVE